MRLLILGGTRFVGPAVVEAALNRGWDVTAFNRGLSGADPEGVQVVHGDRSVSGDVADLASRGPWEAVIDLAGYVPRETLAVCRALEAVAGRYTFMSTVSVYRDWPSEPLSESSAVLECPPDAGPDYGEDVEDGPTQYGYQKSGSEEAVRQTFGADRALTLRPGVVLGPREYVGRLPWWLQRIAAGGPVLAPGREDRTIQPIDVRDLAEFAVHAATAKLTGALNMAAPIDGATFGDLLHACIQTTGSMTELVWTPDADLLAQGVRQWSELPLWRIHKGVWQVDSSTALAAGLQARPIRETVADTWRWMRDEGYSVSDQRATEIGITREKERAIIAAGG